MLRALSSKLHNSSALNAAAILVHLTICTRCSVVLARYENFFASFDTKEEFHCFIKSAIRSHTLRPFLPPAVQVKKALTHKQTPNAHTANEGSVRIKYKCLVPIYVFPKMKLWDPVISKTELYVMFCLQISTFMYMWAGSLCLFCCSQIDRQLLGILKIAHRYMNVGIGEEAAQFYFWEYINRTAFLSSELAPIANLCLF